VSLLIIAVFLNSCASIFNPTEQEVNIVTNDETAVYYIDGEKKASGDSVQVTLKKEMKGVQLKIESEKNKDEYLTILQTRYSALYFMSYFPGLILLWIPPLVDVSSDKRKNYEEKYVPEDINELPKWDDTKKRIELGDFKYELSSDSLFYYSLSLRSYNNIDWYSDYGNDMYDDDPDNSYTNMSDRKKDIDAYNFDLKKSVYDILKKTKFVDTTNTIFMDNYNTLTLSNIIKKENKYEIIADHRTLNDNFFRKEIVSEWILTNRYGDTLLTKDMYSVSGEFSYYFYDREERFKLMTTDAIIESYIRFMNDPEVIELFKKEEAIVEFDDLLITKPTNYPKDLAAAMKATVTIKNDKGHGSGFIISNDGYILTNFHVVSNREDQVVLLSDGKELEFELVRSDRFHDVALIKVEHNFESAFNLPLKKNFDIGNEIYAIGTPKSIELGQSLSKGIVSGFREKDGMKIIQTDASINSGNSGGPLVTKEGILIGIAEYKLAGFNTDGISFAIPANEVFNYLKIKYE
jgi:hypothetical protein